MWITRTRREEASVYLKCIGFGTACMAFLMWMMICL